MARNELAEPVEARPISTSGDNNGGGQPAPAKWSPPEIDASKFRQRFGSSLVEEFVAGHDPADVLRELVQNEFDAGGSTITVEFGLTGLSVIGNGRAIDARGWSRLDVIMGTGLVVGGGAGTIAAKENGIGSKNFGLRSLFLFGDRIHVRSAGKMAILDLRAMGTLLTADPSSRRTKGISIFVPYRDEAFQSLQVFDPVRESKALDQIADTLFGTLAKLAMTGRRGGIRRLVIESIRNDRRLEWMQSAISIRSPFKGVLGTRRVGRLTDRRDKIGRSTSTSFEEIEFSRSVKIPDKFSDISYPAYYRTKGDSIAVAVSLPIKRRRIDLTAPGQFHYPIRAPKGSTGTTVSVSAPFKLDQDRSELTASPWNQWLSETAGALTADLVSRDWVNRFGADALLALRKLTIPNRTWFIDALQIRLRDSACWPTEHKRENAKPSEIVIPDEPWLSGFLSQDRYLRKDLAQNQTFREMCLGFGAKRFTLNSLVRLRCAPLDKSKLSTKTGPNEADYHYSDYEASMSDTVRQIDLATALLKSARHLSNQNRKDLKETRSTLSADGTLSDALSLVTVSPEIWDVCPEPLRSRLHPSLLTNKLIANFCRPFNPGQWVIAAAERAGNGTIEKREREALYEHLLKFGGHLSHSAINVLRRNPVIKNTKGQWCAPSSLAILPRDVMTVLRDVVDSPSNEFAKQESLVRRFGIRQRVSSDDLVGVAKLVQEAPERATASEALLVKNQRLITRSVAEQLRTIPFLRAASGTFDSPDKLHLDTPLNRVCLDDASLIVDGSNLALYRMLGCRELPSSEALLNALAHLRNLRVAPVRPDLFYPALVLAAQSEKRSLALLSNDPILWIKGSYKTPAETLVGATVPKWIDIAIPVFRGQALIERAFEDLGAARTPHDAHWIAFFNWFADRAISGQPRPPIERKAMHLAYYRRGSSGLPEDFDSSQPVLLSRDGMLHSMQNLRDGTFLEDDYPQLAQALKPQSPIIAFADVTETSSAFFAKLKLLRLSEVCGIPEVVIGPESTPPNWFRDQHKSDTLALVQSPAFAWALWGLARARREQFREMDWITSSDIAHRLNSIRRIIFAVEIVRKYTVTGISAQVDADWAFAGDRIALKPCKSLFEFFETLSHVLAEAIGAVRLSDQRALATAIFPLLNCRSPSDMAHYLRQQGIEPPAGLNIQTQDDEEEFNDQFDSGTEDSQGWATANDGDRQANEIIRQLAASLATRPDTGARSAPAAATPPPPILAARNSLVDKPIQVFVLPSLGEVEVRFEAPTGAPQANSGKRSNGVQGSSYSSWTPPSYQDDVRDRMVGERGEELVYRHELERLRSLGHEAPETMVTWVSRDYPGADHDIISVAEDGKPLWIEVKSTIGTDGRFEWSKSEFEKACREGDHYELWRVYQAQSTQPVAKPFRDPISRLGSGTLRIEVATLRAFVEGE